MTFIKINGLKINYEKTGKGKPLIFLHGIFMDNHAYPKLIKILNKKYTVYSIDMPTMGKSETPKKYMAIADFVNIIEKFVKKLKLKKISALGHSAGGLTLLEYCSKNPVEKLFLINPAGIHVKGSASSRIFKTLIGIRLIQVMKYRTKCIRHYRVALKNFIKNLFNKNFWKLYSNEVISDYSAAASKIKSPTTILWGKYDILLGTEGAEVLNKKIKNSKLVWLDGDHDWCLYKPEMITKHI